MRVPLTTQRGYRAQAGPHHTVPTAMTALPCASRITQTVITHTLALALVLSVLATLLSHAADQPPSGPPDMLALYLTHIDGKALRLSYPAQHQTYTLRITPQTVFCNHGRRAPSWAYLQETIGKGKNVITVKTDPEHKVALMVWNVGPSLVTQGTSHTDTTTRLDFP